MRKIIFFFFLFRINMWVLFLSVKMDESDDQNDGGVWKWAQIPIE